LIIFMLLVIGLIKLGVGERKLGRRAGPETNLIPGAH
jgi:hypothetical protein